MVRPTKLSRTPQCVGKGDGESEERWGRFRGAPAVPRAVSDGVAMEAAAENSTGHPCSGQGCGAAVGTAAGLGLRARASSAGTSWRVAVMGTGRPSL